MYLDEPELSTARKKLVLSSIRNRQERGRRHRTALLSACGAVALIMLYLQFRPSLVEPKTGLTHFALATPNQESPAVSAAAITAATSSDKQGKELSLSPIVGPSPKVQRELDQPADAKRLVSTPSKVGQLDHVKKVMDAGTPAEVVTVEEVNSTLSVDALWGLVDHQRAGRHYSQAITTLERDLSA